MTTKKKQRKPLSYKGRANEPMNGDDTTVSESVIKIADVPNVYDFKNGTSTFRFPYTDAKSLDGWKSLIDREIEYMGRKRRITDVRSVAGFIFVDVV